MKAIKAKLKLMAIGRLYGRKRFQRFFRRLHKISLQGMGFGRDSVESEIEILGKTLSGSTDSIIFDIGANKGSWTQVALDKIPRSHIYSFEPSRLTYGVSVQSLGKNPRVSLYNLAISSVKGTKELHSDHEGSSLSSLYQRRTTIKFDHVETVNTTTLDTFCLENSIKKIDWLKIDAEGNELEVLRGAEKLIEQGAIKCIQFEFGGTQIDSRTFFKDFYDLLSPRYDIHQILVDGLHKIKNYNQRLEIFEYVNYLAILKYE